MAIKSAPLNCPSNGLCNQQPHTLWLDQSHYIFALPLEFLVSHWSSFYLDFFYVSHCIEVVTRLTFVSINVLQCGRPDGIAWSAMRAIHVVICVTQTLWVSHNPNRIPIELSSLDVTRSVFFFSVVYPSNVSICTSCRYSGIWTRHGRKETHSTIYTGSEASSVC